MSQGIKVRGTGGSGGTKRETMLYPPTISYFPHNPVHVYPHSRSYALKPQPTQQQATPEHVYSLYACPSQLFTSSNESN